MKIKQGTKYLLRDMGRSMAVYYAVMMALLLIQVVLLLIFSSSETSVSGMESTTIIFLFVLGLNMFRAPLRLFVQCGLSRRTLWTSFLLAALAACAAATVLDTLYMLLIGLIPRLRTVSLYAGLYLRGAKHITVAGLAWTLAMLLAALCSGFCIGALFYRMNRPVKLLVSIGVPAMLFIGFPIAEMLIPSFHGFTTLLRFIAWAMGQDTTPAVPWRAVASLLALAAAMSGGSLLLSRRAMLKEA